MKILTNKKHNSLVNKYNDMCKEIQDLKEKHFKEKMALLDKLEELREIKETKLLASKYDYVICAKGYHANIYVDGKKEKKIKEVHFKAKATEVPQITIKR